MLINYKLYGITNWKIIILNIFLNKLNFYFSMMLCGFNKNFLFYKQPKSTALLISFRDYGKQSLKKITIDIWNIK